MKDRLILTVLLVAGHAAVAGDELPPEQTEFFERKIRPLLVEHCYECHSAEHEQEGDLLLDSRAGVLGGGASGAAVVPGEPDNSVLISAVRYHGDRQMPPDGKLSDAQIADLEAWVRMGAPDPRDGTRMLVGTAKLFDEATRHWAFQPVKETLPPIEDTAARTPIDAFLLAELGKHGRGFSAKASRRTLIRRAYADLIGLPPSPETVQAFITDDHPDSFERLIDRLLESPHYGERWGRHWLDVARYADTMGAIFNGDDSYPFAYTYRDYVVQAFNEDKPYDQFVTEQLAADLLPQPPEDNRALAALGFLTVGRRTDRRVDNDVYDDRIDLITRGLMGLTAACARCHHHKLEPVTQFDYYALFGVLRGGREAQVYPLMAPQPVNAATDDYGKQNRDVRSRYVTTLLTASENVTVAAWSRVGDYLLAAHESDWKTTDDHKSFAEVLQERDLHKELHNALVGARESWLEAHPEVFSPWLMLITLPDDDFQTMAPELFAQFRSNADQKLHPAVVNMFQEDLSAALEDVAERYNRLFADVDTRWRPLAAIPLKEAVALREDDLNPPFNQFRSGVLSRLNEVHSGLSVSDANVEALRQILTAAGSPVKITPDRLQAGQLFTEEHRKKLDELSAEINALSKHPGAPVRLMAMKDDGPHNGNIFIRGDPGSQGDPAPRRFFEVLAGPDRPVLSETTSGRLELARAIVSPENPLTARVIINRVWTWHFGRALVATTSDFGLRGEAPTHPELLDWLVTEFIDQGWSLKQLHRTLLLTDAWQQRSDVSDELRATDPVNRLLGWMNPGPLEFEPFRDSLLAVSGRLDSKLGGRSLDLSDQTAVRRTIYGNVDRKTLPGLFRSFDFPDPNFSAATRNQTALTPQSLFLLNSPWAIDCARMLAERSGIECTQSGSEADPTEFSSAEPANVTDNGEQDQLNASRVNRLFQLALQRDPTDQEVAGALSFVDGYAAEESIMPEVTSWSYGAGDYQEDTQSVVNFRPLEFSDSAVRGTQADGLDLTGLEITAQGGTTAQGKATIRRWTSPFDDHVDIYAELIHTDETGAGVICRVVSGRTGLLGEWSVTGSSRLTELSDVEVQRGDTLDFVSTSREDSPEDSFQWAPVITMPNRDLPTMQGIPMRWDAQNNFRNPGSLPRPLNAWEELSQVLLMSNEFSWVD